MRVKKENSTELCKKIRNILKQLRQLENGEGDTSNGIEIDRKPSLLQLEIVPNESGNPIDAGENSGTDVVIKEEPTEFYNESVTAECTEEPDEKRSKPRRNPRRDTKLELRKEQTQISPLGKVFVSAIKNPDRNPKRQAKSPMRISEMPSLYDHTEQLYEFGKYVAEQLMCFDEKEVRLAQANINEVLSKFRLSIK